MKFLFTLLFLNIAASVFAQKVQQKLSGVVIDTNTSKYENIIINCGCQGRKNQKLLFIIDGKISDSARLSVLKPNEIEGLEVVKPPLSEKVFGERGKNGAILIELKTIYPAPEVVRTRKGIVEKFPLLSKQPLYIINNKPADSVRFHGKHITIYRKGVSEKISSDEITSSKIVTDAPAAAIYGSRGANGVVFLTVRED